MHRQHFTIFNAHLNYKLSATDPRIMNINVFLIVMYKQAALKFNLQKFKTNLPKVTTPELNEKKLYTYNVLCIRIIKGKVNVILSKERKF